MKVLLHDCPDYIAEASRSINPYVFLPKEYTQTQDIYVREDYFDDLAPTDYAQVMDILEPYQSSDISQLGIFGFGKEAKARRKQRAESRRLKKEAKNRMRSAKADAIDRGDRPNIAGDIISTVGNVAKSIIGGATDPADSEMTGVERIQGPQGQQAGVGGILSTKVLGMPLFIAIPVGIGIGFGIRALIRAK